MDIGSEEHRRQLAQELLRIYQENIWKDQVYLFGLEKDREVKREQIEAIANDIAAKKFPSKNDGERAKFTAEQELASIESEILEVKQKIEVIWPAKAEYVKQVLLD